MIYARRRGDTWEVTIDYPSWEEAAPAAIALRVPCPIPGHETRSACIVPRNRRGKGGRRCQLVMRFQPSRPGVEIGRHGVAMDDAERVKCDVRAQLAASVR